MSEQTSSPTLDIQAEYDLLCEKFSPARLKSDENDGQVLVVPELQGRVMTSCCGGASKTSFGWMNYDLIRQGILPEQERQGLQKQIHVFGGEERFWLGPEGGPFGLFFPPKSPNYDFNFWKTPDFIDTHPFGVVNRSDDSVSFSASGKLTNKAGTCFEMEVSRQIQLVSEKQLQDSLSFQLGAELDWVSYRTTNCVTNIGNNLWEKEYGLPSIWLLGMLKPDPSVVMIVPYGQSKNPTVCNDDYFQKPDDSRLADTGSHILFKGDGDFRSKIGIGAERATNVCGSYSRDAQCLTILQFNLPTDCNDLPYVRSQWDNHPDQFKGDVINCYNDGPTGEDNQQLGPFYELESSSPGLQLAPNNSYTHTQTTSHFIGSKKTLNDLAIKVLGIDLNSVEAAF